MGKSRNVKREFSLKDIEDICYEMFANGDISLTQYLGHGLYNLGNGFIVNEKMLEEIDKGIRKSLK